MNEKCEKTKREIENLIEKKKKKDPWTFNCSLCYYIC